MSFITHSVADIYADLAPAVLGYMRGRGARDPENLTGDVFVRVAEGLGTFRGDRAALRRWVFTIAHNLLVDEFRRARPPHDSMDTSRTRLTIDDELPFDQDLLEALRTLSDDQREVLVLRFIADLPVKDVARVVGKRPGAVKMLQARGLANLSATLADDTSG